MSRRRFSSAVLAGVAVLALMLLAPASSQALSIISQAGPITEIAISPTLQCNARYAGDQFYEFFGGLPGSCTPILARGERTYDESGELQPVSQSAVLGSGSSADPLRVTTVVCAGTVVECGTGAPPLVTVDVTYVVGQDFYRTDLRVQNRTSAAETIAIYQYADCYLQDSDQGYGYFDATTGGIYCSAQPNNAPAARIEGFVPVDVGSSFYEAGFSTVFNSIVNQPGQPLPNGCECGVLQDNGMALGWAGLTLPASGTVERSFLTAFSPVGTPVRTVPPPDPPATTSDSDGDGIPDSSDDSDASVPPRIGETVIARVVSGDVFVRLPAASRPRGGARAAQAPSAAPVPSGFTPLKGAEVLPVGTIVHATRGRLALTSAASRINGRTQTQRAEFYAGTFQIRQKRGRRPTTDIALRSTNFAQVCGSGARARGFAARGRSKRVVSRLWGNGKGRFRTRGRHSAATVRGTIWLTEERCDGTLTRVTRGVVSVRDERARRTVIVRAGTQLPRPRGSRHRQDASPLKTLDVPSADVV